jgi:hypothetical protein
MEDSVIGVEASGTPSGRPKVSAEIRDLAHEDGLKAIKRLVALMHSKN